MIHYTILIFIVIILSAFSFVGKRSRLICFWICICLLMFLHGFRAATVGNDTIEYIRIFNEVKNGSDFSMSRYELGYLWFNKILSYISSNPQIVFISSGIFIYYSVGRFILKYSNYPWLSIILFLSYSFFTFFMGTIRQAIAISILLYSFKYLLNGNLCKFLIIVILASFFHITAVFFSFAYLSRYIKPSLKNYSLIALFAIIGLLSFNLILSKLFSIFSMYEHYDGGKYFGETRIASILYVVISFSILIISGNIIKKRISSFTHAYQFEIRCEIVMVLFAVILFLISTKLNILDRIAIYYNLFTILLLPNAIRSLTYKKRMVSTAIITLFFYAYTVTILVIRPEWTSIFPYTFCFE